MKNNLSRSLRALSVREYYEIWENKDARKHLLTWHYPYWLQSSNTDGYVARTADEDCEAPIIPLARSDSKYYARPVLCSQKDFFKVGEMFTFGRDLWNLPLRWVAVSKNILILVDNIDVAVKKDHYGTNGIYYCNSGEAPLWVTYEESDLCIYIEKIFAEKSFNKKERTSLVDGNFEHLLVSYNGELRIPDYVDEIPANRCFEDEYCEKLIILSRNKPLRIGFRSFFRSNIISVEGLDNIDCIDVEAFQNTVIDALTIGNVNKICSGAFSYGSLEKLTINGTIGLVGDYAFANNYVHEVECPGNILEIGPFAFSGNYLTNKMASKITDAVILQYHSSIFDKQKKGLRK